MPRVFALLALCACGCFGGTQNPAYVPSFLPAGDVVRTHAKPAGFGYFRDFDRKAKLLELSPTSQTIPPRTQVVLIATVLDAEGDARRRRRVEWIVEGPGTIVEVDESGVFAGRGYKVDNKYAVSYTDYFEHCLTRGNDDPRDDVTVKAGQTWCVVSSAVPGETIVTAYAPGVFDWEKGRAFAKLTFTGEGFSAGGTGSSLRDWTPPAAGSPAKLALEINLARAVAVNREATATVTLANRGAAESAAATVRATVPEGTEFIRADPPPTRRAGRDLVFDLGRIPAGQPRDIALTLKPTRAGPLTLLTTAETADGLRADHKATAEAGEGALAVKADGGPAGVRVTVTNNGSVPIENATAFLALPEGLTHSGGANTAEARVGTVEPGKSRTVEVALTAGRAGSYPVPVNVTADGGLTGRATATVTAQRAELDVRVVGPERVPVGQEAIYEVRVMNAGDGGLGNLTVRASVPRGVSVKETSGPRKGTVDASTGVATWNLGAIAPAETKTVRVAATADRLTSGSVTASAAADPAVGPAVELRTSAPVAVYGTPVLVLDVTPPDGPVAVGGRAAFRATVRNRGTAAAKTVYLTADLSAELKPVGGRGPGRSDARIDGAKVIFAAVDELAPGMALVFVIDADAAAAGDARAAVQVRAADLPRPLQDEQAVRVRPR